MHAILEKEEKKERLGTAKEKREGSCVFFKYVCVCVCLCAMCVCGSRMKDEKEERDGTNRVG